MQESIPHAAELSDPERDRWWNADYLRLLVSRWGLTGPQVVADIGCGMGHWSSLLLGALAPGSRLIGIDREGDFVARAPAAVRGRLARAEDYRVDFRRADATSLPLGNDEVDIVTCQMMLMHLADPKAALAEMVRVVRPGGLVVCVEPDNLFRCLGYDSLTEDRPIDDLVDEYRFWLCVHRGRLRAGLGNDSVGRLLPGYLSELGLGEVQVAMSDKAHRFGPPYDDPAQAAWVAQLKDWRAIWNYDLLRLNASFVESDAGWLDRRLDALTHHYRERAAAVERGGYHTCGARLMFVVWGRKPLSEVEGADARRA